MNRRAGIRAAVTFMWFASLLAVIRIDTGRALADSPLTVRAAGTTTAGDPVIAAMLEEMERSKTGLHMDGVAPPYYIEYCVTDYDEYTAEAAFGSLKDEMRSRRRSLCVVVRIGDYNRDSYVGRGVIDQMPLDDNPIALRHQLWLATDKAYKAAGETLATKAQGVKEAGRDASVPDFSRERTLQRFDPLVRLDLDSGRWRKMLEGASAPGVDLDGVLSLDTTARFTAVNRYFVNSEGTITRTGLSRYLLGVNGTALTADGMMLRRSPIILAPSAAELPSSEQFASEVKVTLESLRALSKAPQIQDEYRGPVLILPDASNDVFAELVADEVLGRRAEPGNPARTAGAYASSLKRQVLPDFLTVVDDPTVERFGEKWLAGSYFVDDEGVKALPVTIVENGKLMNYLVGRTPIRGFPVSNGHGRRLEDGPAAPAPGNFFVRSSLAFPREDLKKKLLDLCREQHLDYGYMFTTLGGIDAPRLIYRVFAEDGHQELVRGAALDQLDPRALREIVAVGNDAEVSNRPETLVSSVICPSVLFRELVVKPAEIENGDLPHYPPPTQTAPERRREVQRRDVP